MFKGLYDDRRAAQATAFLLHLAGGELGLLKLTKLLYLAERRSYELYGEPLTGDTPFAMKNGPVLSVIYDRTKHGGGLNDTWRPWVRGREGNLIRSAKQITDPKEELTALSKADFRVLSEIWGEFGGRTASQLVNYTHTRCPEWSDPGVSAKKIDPDSLLRKAGLSREEASAVMAHLRRTGELKAVVEKSSRTAA